MTVSEAGSATAPDSGTRAESLLKLELAARCVRTLTKVGCNASSICRAIDGAMTSKLEARFTCSAMLVNSRWAS